MYNPVASKSQPWRFVFILLDIFLIIAWVPVVALLWTWFWLGLGDSGHFYSLSQNLQAIFFAFGPPVLALVSILGVRKFKSWGYIITIVLIPISLSIFLSLFAQDFWGNFINSITLFLP